MGFEVQSRTGTQMPAAMASRFNVVPFNAADATIAEQDTRLISNPREFTEQDFNRASGGAPAEFKLNEARLMRATGNHTMYNRDPTAQEAANTSIEQRVMIAAARPYARDDIGWLPRGRALAQWRNMGAQVNQMMGRRPEESPLDLSAADARAIIQQGVPDEWVDRARQLMGRRPDESPSLPVGSLESPHGVVYPSIAEAREMIEQQRPEWGRQPNASMRNRRAPVLPEEEAAVMPEYVADLHDPVPDFKVEEPAEVTDLKEANKQLEEIRHNRLQLMHCAICLGTVINPVFHGCGNVFCSVCWHDSIRTTRNNNCPVCRGDGFERVVPSLIERHVLDQVTLECQKCKRQKISVRDWKKHQDEQCGPRCANKGCSVSILSDQDQTDHNITCMFVTINCPETGCQFTGMRKNLWDHLDHVCELRMHRQLEEKATRTMNTMHEGRENLATHRAQRELETTAFFGFKRYDEIKSAPHFVVDDNNWSWKSPEFTFTHEGKQITVSKDCCQLFHAVIPNRQAASWMDLQVKLFYCPVPDFVELTQPYQTQYEAQQRVARHELHEALDEEEKNNAEATIQEQRAMVEDAQLTRDRIRRRADAAQGFDRVMANHAAALGRGEVVRMGVENPQMAIEDMNSALNAAVRGLAQPGVPQQARQFLQDELQRVYDQRTDAMQPMVPRFPGTASTEMIDSNIARDAPAGRRWLAGLIDNFSQNPALAEAELQQVREQAGINAQAEQLVEQAELSVNPARTAADMNWLSRALDNFDQRTGVAPAQAATQHRFDEDGNPWAEEEPVTQAEIADLD